MIIGQGQLDTVLNSRPEDRRAIIEEAAGVLKHRRRQERAERRLAATQENLERLGDLVREVRRQIRPLERQAASAQSFSDVESELRNARRALFAQRLQSFELRRRELDAALESAAAKERGLRSELVTLDAQATAAAAEMASRREEMLASTLGTLQGLSERARGTLSIIQERERSLRMALIASADENVIATLEADAAKLVNDLSALEDEESRLSAEREQVSLARATFTDHEATFDATWSGVMSDVDEAMLRSAIERVELLERSMSSLQDSERRGASRLSDERARTNETLRTREEATRSLEQAQQALDAARQELSDAEQDAAHLEQERRDADEALGEASEAAARTQARAEALARALEEMSGAGGRAIIGNLEGVLGSFLDLIEIDRGWERAVESAAGASVGAMVVDGSKSARAALEALRREGGAGLILPVGENQIVATEVPGNCTSLRELVRARSGAPEHVTRVLDALFARAFVASDWESGIDVAVANPDLVIVTRDGDRFAASGWRVASGRALVTRSTVEEAQRAASDAAIALQPIRNRRTQADESAVAARQRLNQASSQRAQAQARFEQITRDIERHDDTLDEIARNIESLTSDVGELAGQIMELGDELASLRGELPHLEVAVALANEKKGAMDKARRELEQERQALSDLATALSRREAEFAERRRLILQRRSEIESRLEGRTSERLEAATRRESLEFDLRVLDRLTGLVTRAAEDIRTSQEALDSTYREQLEASRASAERLEAVRKLRNETEARMSEVAEQTHRGEIERAELAVMLSNLHDVIRRDLGVEPHDVGPVDELDPADGSTLESRVGELEARITSLGPINPLALEELRALEERYRELDEQVSDVRNARRELQEVLRALDEEIMQTFSSAVADVNEHFSTLVSMLFPGGQGRLILTDPDDPLNTGVEIEVRPMGRNVRRISLLSGGERSMAALAFLFAVFRSRPSPFYMMDEVEAALNDVNLQRFLSLVDEFRHEAQLLIVTHQKRTMEAADALYGVTMVPGASSKVVSQRVNRTLEVETA